MTLPAAPTATYRLQFNRDFSFADATALVPYLHQLGISHVYASPYLKARAGSPHGYDIVDHHALNPEIGDTDSFAALVRTLSDHGMGQILDIVPNHMGVGGDDNNWWLDVLENGEASRYAPYFDIDWHPAKTALRNKVLLPFLGDHYGAVLENGELQLKYESDSLGVRYYDHLFPIDPRTYPQLLSLLQEDLADLPEARSEVQALIETCWALPRRTDLSEAERQHRREAGTACKQELARLCRDYPEFAERLQRSITQFNGTVGQPYSFDRLHHLLESQAYRLAYWQVASDEINYRRFFDINDLAGLRMEQEDVFDVTHRLIREMIGAGQIHGLRIDHPDGLNNPYKYFHDLQQMAREARPGEATDQDQPYYLLVEKILASHERLPGDWPVAGTTGYEVAFLLNGLFVHPGGERPLERIYMRFIRHGADFNELLYERKKLIIQTSLSSELNVLANLANGITETNRRTRDFTLQGLRNALGEVVASFPVYRTYISAARSSEADKRYVRWATAQAKRRSPVTDTQIFDFIHDLLLLEHPEKAHSNLQRNILQLALRVQQYTAPVMAKAMEDTAFYTYNRLVSLNDVGFDPRVFAISTAAFHQENSQRLHDWPEAMVSTSTHDSKRSEDVRARINVLSELAEQWRRHLSRWRRINRYRKRLIDDVHAPSHNDEYLLYQILIGVWPLPGAAQAGDVDALRERVEAYMIKAIKEAKVHTSWTNPNAEYEEAMRHFVGALLHDPERNAFLADFLPFQRRVARLGLYNGLSQTLLKLTVPGVPDIYQGNELWCFNLVDPDNRRPVDYAQRQALLQGLTEAAAQRDAVALSRALLEQIEDGRAKLYVTWKTLQLRRAQAELFGHGDYLALTSEGGRADHICAFARRRGEDKVVVAATRWFAALLEHDDSLPLGGPLWEDTWVEAPQDENGQPRRYRNLFTDEIVMPEWRGDKHWFHAAALFANFSVALLRAE